MENEKVLKTSIQFFSVEAVVSEKDIQELFQDFQLTELPYRWECGPKEQERFYWMAKLDTEETAAKALEAVRGKTLKGKPIECRIKARRVVEAVPVDQAAASMPPSSTRGGGQQQPRQKGRPAPRSKKSEEPAQLPPAPSDQSSFPSLSTASPANSAQHASA
jgi:hypothetical protein